MIRKATMNDYISIVRSIQNKHIEYITATHIKNDIKNEQLYIIEINNKIIAFASCVYCKDFNNYAIKRLCVPNKKNNGKGYAQKMINFLVNNRNKNFPLVITPWKNNSAMIHMVEKLGFEWQYNFNKVWTLYQINADLT